MKVAKEDILRVIVELRTNSASIIQAEIDMPELFTQAVRELEKEELIQITNSTILLTPKGREAGQHIAIRHKTIEDYFRLELGEQRAHSTAHVLEHTISQEVIKALRKIHRLASKGEPLIEQHSREGLITSLDHTDSHLFDRMISMGICPGQWLRVITDIPGGLVILLGNTLLVVGEEIAKKIRVIFS